MAESKNQELEKQGKKKAKIENLEGGSSSLPSIEGGGYMSDGGIDEDGGGGVEDPLVLFGSGVMMIILSKMDARSVALSRLVSRGWLAVASTDRIWAPKDLFDINRDWHLNGDPIQNLSSALYMECQFNFLGKRCSSNHDGPTSREFYSIYNQLFYFE